MRYYIEQIRTDPSPGLRIIERHKDGSETVIWYLQTQHTQLILKEVVGDYLLLGDSDGKFSRFHIPTQTLTHTQQLARNLGIGAIVSSGGFTIMVTMNNDNDYAIPYLVRLDCRNLEILSDFRLPFELNYEDEEEDDLEEEDDDDSEEEYQRQIDCYDLDVYSPTQPVPGQLWLYACNANRNWDKPEPHEFYRLDLLGQQESLLPMPCLGNASSDLCAPALNLASNLGAMLSWDEAPITEVNGEQYILLQLELFDIDKCEVIRKLPLRSFSLEQLKQRYIDVDVLLAGPDEDIEEYCKELADIYEKLTDMRWQEDKLRLTFTDQILLLDIQGNVEVLPPSKEDTVRHCLPEAKLAEELEGRHLIHTDDVPQAMQQLLKLCQNVEAARYGDLFAFALRDCNGNPVKQEDFFGSAVAQHAQVMTEMVEQYCDYLDSTYLKRNLWDGDYSSASLCHLVYALASTGNTELLPLIARYVSFTDADHENFVKEELVPHIHSVFGEDLPLVQEITELAEYDDGEWDEDWEDDD